MLIGMAGLLTGYDGNFSFSKPGVSYAENNIKYVGMRRVSVSPFQDDDGGCDMTVFYCVRFEH